MKREPALEAMRRWRRAEMFARRARLPTDAAMAQLDTVLAALRRFNGRSLRRTTLMELLRETRCTDPVRFFEAMHFRGFFAQSELGAFLVDVAPDALCVVTPPLSPAAAEKRFRKAFNDWLWWLYKRAGIEAETRLI